MDSKAQLTGLKKRQQIHSANKMIFVWIVGASVIVSMCLVFGQFLVRQAIFNQKIISAKGNTVKTLDSNIKNVKLLTEQVDALVANKDLASVRANPNDSNLKVVLDALPTEDDQTALASSLQNVILKPSGVNVRDLTISQQNLVAAGDTSQAQGAVDTTQATPTAFNFSVLADYEQIKTMLKDMERSIRPMNVRTLSLQGTDTVLQVTVNGETYYLPQKNVELKKKQVKP